MAENWAAYGFPDDIMFRTPYVPWHGLVNALNERRQAVNLSPFQMPDYFTVYGGMYWEGNFNDAFWEAASKYVNPDAVSTATRYDDCFWDVDDLNTAALDGENPENVTSYSRPKFSVKWAIWTYNKINLLRYVATTEWYEWPTFTYTDINDTFNFKV